jgi:hypothetical protein
VKEIYCNQRVWLSNKCRTLDYQLGVLGLQIPGAVGLLAIF